MAQYDVAMSSNNARYGSEVLGAPKGPRIFDLGLRYVRWAFRFPRRPCEHRNSFRHRRLAASPGLVQMASCDYHLRYRNVMSVPLYRNGGSLSRPDWFDIIKREKRDEKTQSALGAQGPAAP